MKSKLLLVMVLLTTGLYAWTPDTLSECDLSGTVIGPGPCDSNIVTGYHELNGSRGTMETFVFVTEPDSMQTVPATGLGSIVLTTDSYSTLTICIDEYNYTDREKPAVYFKNGYDKYFISTIDYNRWIPITIVLSYDCLTLDIDDSLYQITEDYQGGIYNSFFADGAVAVTVTVSDYATFWRMIVSDATSRINDTNTKILNNHYDTYMYDLAGSKLITAKNFKGIYIKLNYNGSEYYIDKIINGIDLGRNDKRQNAQQN